MRHRCLRIIGCACGVGARSARGACGASALVDGWALQETFSRPLRLRLEGVVGAFVVQFFVRAATCWPISCIQFFGNIQWLLAEFDARSISGTCGIGASVASIALAASVPAALA